MSNSCSYVESPNRVDESVILLIHDNVTLCFRWNFRSLTIITTTRVFYVWPAYQIALYRTQHSTLVSPRRRSCVHIPGEINGATLHIRHPHLTLSPTGEGSAAVSRRPQNDQDPPLLRHPRRRKNRTSRNPCPFGKWDSCALLREILSRIPSRTPEQDFPQASSRNYLIARVSAK